MFFSTYKSCVSVLSIASCFLSTVLDCREEACRNRFGNFQLEYVVRQYVKYVSTKLNCLGLGKATQCDGDLASCHSQQQSIASR